MLKTLKGILKTGDATVKYPFAPIEQAPDVRGKPEHDALRCLRGMRYGVSAECDSNGIEQRSGYCYVDDQLRQVHFLRSVRRGLPG